MRDTIGVIIDDAAKEAKRMAAIVTPHITLDNAIKVGQLVNAILDVRAKLKPAKP